MRRVIVFSVLGLAAHAPLAGAQPADCTPDPAPQGTMPLFLGLGGMPGVPRGLRGQVEADVPVSPYGTTCQAAEPNLPKDVLHGDPGNLLSGDDPHDVLSGASEGHVYIDVK